jgi:hypothetical protein
MKWLFLLLALPLLLATACALLGSFLPRQHEAGRQAVFHRTPAELFALVRDFANTAAWRTGLKSVELLPPRDGRPCYREAAGHRAVTYVVLEERPAEKLVVKIDDDDLPYGGSWTYEFATAPEGARVRITEHGEVKNVVFRFLGRFVFGYDTTIDTYLRDLGRKVGETVTPGP